MLLLSGQTQFYSYIKKGCGSNISYNNSDAEGEVVDIKINSAGQIVE